MNDKKRLETLDVFRGMAALSVMLLHYTYGYRIHFGQSFNPAYDFRYGYLGVQFFFIISGFVIFLTVLNSKSVFDFIYKRITRLYPTFIICLCITFALTFVFGLPGREKSLRTAVLNISMIPGFFKIPAVDGAYWSLIPEVFFYVLMICMMSFKQMKNILWVGCLFLCFTWVNKFICAFPYKLNMILNAQWNSLFFAGILFYKIKYEQKKRLFNLLILLSYITVCISLNSITERVITASFFFLFYLFSYNKLEWLTWRPLVFIGLISYPLYLIHQNAGYIILNKLKPAFFNNPVVFIALPVCIMIGVAYMIHNLIEKPSIRFSRRYKKQYFDF